MEAGINQDQPSRERGKWALLFVAGAVVVAAVAVLVVHHANKSSSASIDAASAPVVVVPDESVAQDECQEVFEHPREMALGCGKLPLTNLNWSNWGTQAATAQGIAHLNDCSPDCASGKFREFPATVELSRIEKCQATGQRRYLTLNVTYLKGKHGGISENFRCPLTKTQRRSDSNARLIAELAIKAKGGAIAPRQTFVNRSSRDPEWVLVSGSTLGELAPYSWNVYLKSSEGRWEVRYAGFAEHHYVAGAPCDLVFSEGGPEC